MTLEHLSAQRLSIIVPALNEAASLPALLDSIRATTTAGIDLEIIVVDGGSEDQTVAIAQRHGAQVLISSRGRASQMNAGARLATGDILLFLHADTRLPTNFSALIAAALAKPGRIAGAFDLKIEGDIPGLRWVEKGVKWRSRIFQLPYGDQAIFLRRETFQAIGGFANLPIMEDFDLIHRLRSLGRIAIVPVPVLTSGRRWKTVGLWKTTLINQAIVIAYLLGVSPQRLASWYRTDA